MRKYETLYILDARLDADATKEMVEKFKELIESQGGVIESIDEWGKRRLAYAINHQREGYYVLMNYEATPEIVADLERNFKITDGLVRYLIINKDK
jgi:small subunit ribosomal protein S6